MNPYGPESQKLLHVEPPCRLPLSARHQKAQEMTTSESREAWLLGGSSQDSDTWLITMASRVVGPLPNGLN